MLKILLVCILFFFTFNAFAQSEIILGSTYYDLQTQASVPSRLALSKSGNLSAVWIHSLSPTAPYLDRGTGYAFYNGSQWSSAPGKRIETSRSGWPSVTLLKNGTEYIVSHHSNQLQALFRTNKGNGPWQEDTLLLKKNEPKAIFWPRVASGGLDGNTLHVIALTQPGIPFAGMNGALTYSRSKDGGTSWDILHSILPGLDSTSNRGFGSDNYAIDAMGDTLAIVVGGNDKDVILMKSVNNGTTWVKKIISAFPIPGFDASTMTTDVNRDGIPDTVQTNDGAMAVLLDKLGQAHIFYGKMFAFCKSPGTGPGMGLRILTYTDSLMYWNETMDARKPYGIVGVFDSNGNGKIDFPTVASDKFPYGVYGVGLSSHPSAAIDSTGTIYLAYSSILETTKAGSKAYRHTYITKSSDRGRTWAARAFDVNPYPYLECVYGSLARNVDKFIHILYQRDDYPGISINPNGGNSLDPENSNNTSDIVYVTVKPNLTLAVPDLTDEIATPTLYPNPASGSVSIDFNLKVAQLPDVRITNTLGQDVLVANNAEKIIGPGALTLSVKDFPRGIYVVHITLTHQSFTSKLLIE